MDTQKQSKSWIGEKYRTGWSAKKVLVLGESSYGGGTNIAAGLVRQHLDGQANRWGRTYDRFLQIMRGATPEASAWTREQCWSRLAFFNFIETSRVPASGQKPPIDEWVFAGERFEERIRELNGPPEVIILWGYRLWEFLLVSKKIAPSGRRLCGVFHFGEATSVSCYAIQHPCCRMSRHRVREWSEWLASALH